MEYEIFINEKRFITTAEKLTGNQIKELAQIPDTYELFEAVKGQNQPIGPDQVVEIKSGEHFRAIPPGTFGIFSCYPHS